MRAPTLIAAMLAGTFFGLASRADASRPGGLPDLRPDLGVRVDPYPVPAYRLGTPYADPFNLLFFGTPWDASSGTEGFATTARAAESLRSPDTIGDLRVR